MTRESQVRSMFSAFLIMVAYVAAASGQTNGEWPQWRGANRDGISKETGLLKQWPDGGPPLAWKASGAGRGYSSFSISKGRFYSLGLCGAREAVVRSVVAKGTGV